MYLAHGGNGLAAGLMKADTATSILGWKIKGVFAVANHLTT